MMKKVIKRTICMFCVSAMLASMQTFAANKFTYTVGSDYNENFESETPQASSTANDGSGVNEESGNRFLYIQQRQYDYFSRFYMDASSSPIKDAATDDATPELFISTDFMIPSMVNGVENLLTTANLLLCRWDTSGLNNGILLEYSSDGRKIVAKNFGASNATTIAENIALDKWHNIFITIDWNKGEALCGELGSATAAGEGVADGRPKYKVYINDIEKKSGVMGNKSGVSTYLKRIFQSNTSNVSSGDINSMYYLDNIKIINTNDTDYASDLAYFKARSMAVNATAGYSDGEVPQNMIDRLMAACETYAADPTSLNKEITLFKGATIDTTNGDDTTAAFVRINPSGEMPIQTAVVPAGLCLPLEAGVYTQKNNTTSGEIVWSVKNADGTAVDSTEVTIDDDGSGGKELNVKYGFEGELVLTATTTRDDSVVLSDTHKLGVVAARVMTLDKIVTENNEIKLEGSFSDTVTQTVNITVDGDDGDAGTTDIYETGTITANPDKSFVWSKTLSGTEVPQKLTISITGSEIEAKTIDGYYYGTGWETAVINEIKGAADAAAIKDVLKLHSKKLYVDTALLDAKADDYCTRIVNSRATYSGLADAQSAIRDAEVVIKFSDISRDEIVDFITANKVILKNNGFDTDDLNGEGITDTERTSFYINASELEIDAKTAAVKDICDDLNDILEPFKGETSEPPINTIDPVTPGNDVASGNNSSGGGGGGVTLVPKPTEPETEVQPPVDEGSTTPVAGFADVNKTDWFYDAVTYMNQAKIMVGDGREMRPNDSVTRGELAKIIVEAFEFEAGASNTFNDGKDKWWGSYAEIAAANGIVNGLSDGVFGGDDVITREMLAVMVDRAIQAKSIELYDQNEGVAFEDSEYVADWAQESIVRLARKGIVSGIGDNMYAPALSVTRAEAAQIIYNVLKQL